MKVTKKINLAQLDQEINGEGLNAILGTNGEIVEVTLAENNSATEADLKNAIEAHKATNPNAVKEAAQAKLAALGLTIEEIQAIGF